MLRLQHGLRRRRPAAHHVQLLPNVAQLVLCETLHHRLPLHMYLLGRQYGGRAREMLVFGHKGFGPLPRIRHDHGRAKRDSLGGLLRRADATSETTESPQATYPATAPPSSGADTNPVGGGRCLSGC